jgi:hypothetical protein
MDTLVTALKETLIPTILVVAGIVFLLLSIAGQLAGRVTVPPGSGGRNFTFHLVA